MAEDLLYYVDRKSKLDSALKEGVPIAPTYSGHVGLINQGFTLYLNSLIQCLFYNVPFRTLVLLESSESPVLKAIQEIFCYLQLSESCAVSTKELVSAFGWSHGQVFEQHDAHELFGLLLDSLGDEDPLLGASLSKMFRGSMTGTIFQLVGASSSFTFMIFYALFYRYAILLKLSEEARNEIIIFEYFIGVGSFLFYWRQQRK